MEIKGISFTEREIDVISCISNGKAVKDIAQMLRISPYTVSSHISNIIRKIDVSSQREVLQFLETSDQYLVIRNKYIDILLHSNFKSILERIANSGIVCDKNVVIHSSTHLSRQQKELLKELEYVGIGVSVDTNPLNGGIESLSVDSFHVLMLSCRVDNEYVFPTTRKNVVAISSKLNRYYTSNHISGIDIDRHQLLISLVDTLYNNPKITRILQAFIKNYAKQTCNNDLQKETKKAATLNKNSTRKIQIILVISIFILFLFGLAKYKNFRFSPNTVSNLLIVNNNRMLPRKELIKSIKNSLHSQDGIKYVFLIGAGGIGKTTTARQYMSDAKTKLKWEIDAETENKTINSLYELADELANTENLKKELTLIKIDTKNVNRRKLKLIKFIAVQLKRFNDWILLFDNVEDFDNLKIFATLLQNTSLKNGCVLVTTRNQNSEYLLEFSKNSFVNVPQLTDNEKSSLFYNILPNNHNLLNQTLRDRIENILKDVPSYPLDISVFAHYVTTNNLGINELECYKKETNYLISYNDARYSILEKSFSKIIDTDPANIPLLTLLCLLDSTDISSEYFLKISFHDVVTKFFSLLKKHGILSTNKGTFNIHRSIQETGLMVLNKLSKKDNTVMLEKIVSKIAEYKSFIGGWYKDKTCSHKYKKNTIKHLENMLYRLNSYTGDEKILSECRLRLLLSLFYAKRSSSPQERLYLGDEILRLINRTSLLTKYDIALFYINMAKFCADVGIFDKCLQFSNQCITLSKRFGFNELLSPGLVFVSRYDKGLTKHQKHQMIENATQIIESLPSYYYGPIIDTANQIYRFYGTNYINQSPTASAVKFLQKITLKLEDYANSSDFLSCPQDFLEMKMNMIRGYNRLGEFDKALVLVEELESLYQKLENLGMSFCVEKARLDVEKGFVFLRQNDLTTALKIFSKIIDSKFLKEITDLFYVYVYRSEILIRLKRFREAYSDCISALNHRESNFNSKYAKLTKIECLYNAIACNYNTKNNSESDGYIKILFKEARDFCSSFLLKNEFNQLIQRGCFNTENCDIPEALKKCRDIMEKIYGANHSFVKDYMNSNLN
ncbi:MAG: LuxR C-terminal-related transcriptional regulator [Alphaproteobacteria bacterium]|nr:LuxR C-terminal-related transcriptional regulator [Alphaproteobacteria bacterium]